MKGSQLMQEKSRYNERSFKPSSHACPNRAHAVYLENIHALVRRSVRIG